MGPQSSPAASGPRETTASSSLGGTETPRSHLCPHGPALLSGVAKPVSHRDFTRRCPPPCPQTAWRGKGSAVLQEGAWRHVGGGRACRHVHACVLTCRYTGRHAVHLQALDPQPGREEVACPHQVCSSDLGAAVLRASRWAGGEGGPIHGLRSWWHRLALVCSHGRIITIY